MGLVNQRRKKPEMYEWDKNRWAKRFFVGQNQCVGEGETCVVHCNIYLVMEGKEKLLPSLET